MSRQTVNKWLCCGFVGTVAAHQALVGHDRKSPDRALVQSCVIQGWLPTMSANRSHEHWSHQRKKHKVDCDTAWAAAKHAGWRYVGDAAPKLRLTVTLTFGQHRKRDTDNLYARVKGCVDGLKPFIVDDDAEHLELIVLAEVVPGVKQTRLELEVLA